MTLELEVQNCVKEKREGQFKFVLVLASGRGKVPRMDGQGGR